MIFFLALFLPSLYYNKYLKDEILSETQARALRELTLIKDLMAREDFHGPEQLHAWLRKVSDPLNVRITYVAEGGRVIADTGVPFDQASSLENLAKRPEIAEAYNQPTGSSLRYSDELNTDLLYRCTKNRGPGNIPGGVLRVAVPLSGIFYSLSNVAIVQHLIILTGFIAFALISLGLMVSASRSVSLLSSAADSIGHGDVKVLPAVSPRPLLLSPRKIDQRKRRAR